MDSPTHPAAPAPAAPAPAAPVLPPKALAEAAGISGAYASMILSGKRPCSSDIALVAFRTFGVRLGLLADMTAADIEKLCSCRSDAQGGAGLSARNGLGFSNPAMMGRMVIGPVALSDAPCGISSDRLGQCAHPLCQRDEIGHGIGYFCRSAGDAVGAEHHHQRGTVFCITAIKADGSARPNPFSFHCLDGPVFAIPAAQDIMAGGVSIARPASPAGPFLGRAGWGLPAVVGGAPTLALRQEGNRNAQ